MSDYLSELAAFAADLRYEDLPDEVVTRSKQVIADTLAVIAAGAQEEEIRRLTDRLADSGSGSCNPAGQRPKSGVLSASLINGTAGTFLGT